MGHPVRVVALDLDGTLLEPGEQIAVPVREGLGAEVARGLLVAIVTGRPLGDILRILEKNELGAGVGWPQFVIAEERDIYWLREGDYQAHQPWNDQQFQAEVALLAISRRIAEQLKEEAAVQGVPVQQSPAEREERRGYVELYYPDRESAARARLRAQVLADASGQPLEAVRNGRLIALRRVGRGKGLVLAEAVRVLGIPRQAVLAIGDSHNDASMLDGQLGFRAATVGNADEEIKAMVRAVGGPVAGATRGMGVLEVVAAVLACA